MDQDKLNNLSKDKKYISGIFNYCDRWCEKCEFKSKCLSYEMSKSTYDGKSIITDKKFWNELEESFNNVKSMLDTYMKEHNIAIPSEEDNSIIQFNMKKIDKLLKTNPILLESQNYDRISTSLLKNNSNFMLDKIKNNDFKVPEISSQEIEEAVEIILFYKNIIFVKISRALHSFYAKDNNDIDGYEEDQLISARIAIVAIERSMTAWHLLFENFNFVSDSIIDLLLQLNYIKLKLEKLIPGIVEYKRPYFD